MRYRLTCLTPTLVGDGTRLSPIDYMVWKDQVSVLDQQRIFKLLARSGRLEGYLTQIKRADKLEFAAWGGFAQNYADRRVPFEHASMSEYWQREKAEQLFIPTFVNGSSGPYLPGSALKGALRTGYAFTRLTERALQPVLAKMGSERPPRRPAEVVEEPQIGQDGHDRMRAVAVADSDAISTSSLRIYLIRTATLQQQGNALKLGWKQSPRGAVSGQTPEQSTPLFAEMAMPGTEFAGRWDDRAFLGTAEITQLLRWREPVYEKPLLRAANEYSTQMLQLHRQYAEQAGLDLLVGEVDRLLGLVSGAQQEGAGVLPLGWGTGFLGKTAMQDPTGPLARDILRQLPYYQRAIASGLPFPKTRKIVFLQNRPATLPGWVRITVE